MRPATTSTCTIRPPTSVRLLQNRRPSPETQQTEGEWGKGWGELEVGEGLDVGLEGLVFGGVGEGEELHELGHVPRDLHPALHERGVGVELALLDLHRVGVRKRQGEVGVVDLAERALEQLPVLE